MVRLEVYSREEDVINPDNFNSSMVRLEEIGRIDLAAGFEFQFQYGAIRGAPTCL